VVSAGLIVTQVESELILISVEVVTQVLEAVVQMVMAVVLENPIVEESELIVLNSEENSDEVVPQALKALVVVAVLPQVLEVVVVVVVVIRVKLEVPTDVAVSLVVESELLLLISVEDVLIVNNTEEVEIERDVDNCSGGSLKRQVSANEGTGLQEEVRSHEYPPKNIACRLSSSYAV
jgi:hypothetical protein